MAQGLEREPKGQSKSKDTDEKISKYVRCSEGRVMGSRRIFPPQFKLQVLDSYRRDEDCKGNQRATARKYGIHRRQIQKWLQVEASLRTSVEVGSERRQASPTALNLTSAGDAGRQRDDSGGVSGGGGGVGGGGGGGGGESLAAAVTTTAAAAAADTEPQRSWTRGAERRDVVDETRRSDAATDAPPTQFLHALKDETEEEDEEEDDEDDDEEEAVSSEDNMDSTKSVYNNDEALDFTCAALGKRRSFSLQFKLEVLNAFHADGLCHGNQRATARKFGINRRQVQKWLGQEVELRGEAAFRGGLYRQRLGRWLELEDGARKGDDRLAAAVMFDQYAATGDYCWDLSSKKRRLEEEAEEVAVESKRVRVESGGVALDISSTSGRRDEGDEAPAYMRRPRPAPAPAPTLAPAPTSLPPLRLDSSGDEQETALCLVKVKATDAEVTSSIDTHALMHESFLATQPAFHLGPLGLPAAAAAAAAYDLYSFHCRHPCFQHLHAPKWFQSRATAVPGFF